MAGAANKPKRKSLAALAAEREREKERFVELVSQGFTREEALRGINRHNKTVLAWRKDDPVFAERIAQARKAARQRSVSSVGVRPEVGPMSFAQFSEVYLGQKVFPHIGNLVDMIEGRQPGWQHPAMVFEPGQRDLIMANLPPEHAKTTSLTINYCTYRMVMDPNIRILLVSKTATMAKKMLLAIKSRLTHPRYQAMQTTFGPSGGYQQGSDGWTQDMIYLSPDARDSGEKDPTVHALGLRGHIYGARADLIVLDDVVDLTNAHEFDKQIDWIQSEVVSRISASGAMLVVGTRLASRDLYSELRDARRYQDESSPWTYMAMPAVLEMAERPEDWVTLWPRSNQPEAGTTAQAPDADGMFPKWDGPRLQRKRARVSPTVWARVYQQQQTAEDTVFKPEDVTGCTNHQRKPGLIPRGMGANRAEGMEGLIVVAGLDPATAGFTAATVVGLDIKTQRRYVLDVFNRANTTPDGLREMIYAFTDKYGVTEWVIETNGFQGFLAHDREVNNYLTARGSIVRPHHTGGQKHDPDFGVAAMSGLFKGHESNTNLIELPSTAHHEGVRALAEQLLTWMPSAPKGQKTDAVMSLWMAELACQRRCSALGWQGRSHAANPYLTRWDASQRQSFNLYELEMR